LNVARSFIDYHTKEFGFERANVEFRLGKIEELTADKGLESNSNFIKRISYSDRTVLSI